MADETLLDRLERLQEQLLRAFAETVELRRQAEHDAQARELSELPDITVGSIETDANSSKSWLSSLLKSGRT